MAGRLRVSLLDYFSTSIILITLLLYFVILCPVPGDQPALVALVVFLSLFSRNRSECHRDVPHTNEPSEASWPGDVGAWLPQHKESRVSAHIFLEILGHSALLYLLLVPRQSRDLLTSSLGHPGPRTAATSAENKMSITSMRATGHPQGVVSVT